MSNFNLVKDGDAYKVITIEPVEKEEQIQC